MDAYSASFGVFGMLAAFVAFSFYKSFFCASRWEEEETEKEGERKKKVSRGFLFFPFCPPEKGKRAGDKNPDSRNKKNESDLVTGAPRRRAADGTAAAGPVGRRRARGRDRHRRREKSALFTFPRRRPRRSTTPRSPPRKRMTPPRRRPGSRGRAAS